MVVSGKIPRDLLENSTGHIRIWSLFNGHVHSFYEILNALADYWIERIDLNWGKKALFPSISCNF